MTTRDPVTYSIFADKTMFIPLRYIYGECWYHIKDSPQMYPLRCFIEDSCPVGANCGDTLVKRVHYLFEEVAPKVEIIVAYYKYHDRPKSVRGAFFSKNLDPPRLSVLNPYALKKFLKKGIAYNWFPSDEYLYMGGAEGIISIESLIK